MLIAQSGLNDPKDKIRLATVNALLKLENHTVSLMKVITLEELLACLDIEVSEEVEKALVKLLLPIVCLEDASMDPRFRNAEEICRTSRGGSLKFHTLMGKHKMITNRNAREFMIDRPKHYLIFDFRCIYQDVNYRDFEKASTEGG